jgi:hypothetical protein
MHKLPEVYQVGDKIYVAYAVLGNDRHLRIYGPISISKVTVSFTEEKKNFPILNIGYNCDSLGTYLVKPEVAFPDYESAYKSAKADLDAANLAAQAQAEIANAASAAKLAQDKILAQV